MIPYGARLAALIVCLPLLAPSSAFALPSPSPLRFVSPTPSAGAIVLTGTVTVQLDASCTFDPGTLAISFNGSPLAAGSFLPFTACSAGRRTSQPVVVGITLPNGSIASGPIGLVAGETGTFGAGGTGDGFLWNFDGGAAPDTGASVAAVFRAAGTFMVRLRATRSQLLAASAFDAGNLVTSQRAFAAGDPTPDTRQVSVAMPPDVDFRNYESAHVHPIALSASRTKLYALNTPEGRLAIFTVDGSGSLDFAGDVPVGLDPVSLATRPGTSEVWVVNQISDSVSVVDTIARKVVATLSVGDEPTDVVFAGDRAFVTLAGRENRVRVFDATSRAEIASLPLFGENPRAMAVNAAGTEVYAVVLNSGNGTTVVPRAIVTAAGGPPPPSPPRSPALGSAPAVALLVAFDPASGRWEDDTGGDWTAAVTYTLPDQDVFIIDADAPVPVLMGAVSGVGTTLFDVAVQPLTGQLWIPNTDARNLVRFEPNLRGHLVETRVSRVTPGTGAVTNIDLNPHIDYGATPGPAVEIEASLAQPGAGVFTSNGAVFYLVGFGSAKVGVLDGTTGTVTARIDVGGGPSGLALHEAVGRLYVLNRFDDTISTVDTSTNAEVAVIGVAGSARFDPSPDAIKNGRRFLYDAQLSSGHGDLSCATCHLFGDVDDLGWDLGDPQGTFVPYAAAPWVSFGPLGAEQAGFDPMKGPMTTQTLRGLLALEPFHWRGDRQNFQHFNGAFVGLLGRATPLSATDMDRFTDFIMTVSMPPNPYRNLDDTLPSSVVIPSSAGGGAMTTGNAVNGWTTFTTVPVDGPFTCTTCHALPAGTSTNLVGTLGAQTQDLKVPQLRSIHRKVGFNPIRPSVQFGNPTNIGLVAQKSGFGLRHEGIVSLTEFMSFQFTMTDQQKRDVTAALLAFPTSSAPAIGRQVTVTASNKTDGAVVSTIATLVAQADILRCGLVVKGVMGGTPKGWMYDASTGLFEPDSLLEAPLSESALRAAVASGDAVTYTGVPPGAEARLGIDRDRDTWLDRTEIVLGTDPANPNSNPWGWAP